MCIMHKFLGIMIKGAHYKNTINQWAAFRSSPIETLYLSDTFSASALIPIRCPDSLKFFLTGHLTLLTLA